MTASSADVATARRVADAVLFEGYALYPYRASALKNRYRWQFGVLAPAAVAEVAGDPTAQRTEVVLDAPDDAQVRVTVRFLHLERRRVERGDGPASDEVAELVVAGRRYVAWDEGTPREVVLPAHRLDALRHGRATIPVTFPGTTRRVPLVEDGVTVGAVVREVRALRGRVTVHAVADGTVDRLVVEVHNDTPWPGRPPATRDEVLPACLLGTHVVAVVDVGEFVSATSPPPGLADVASRCRNLHAWPVLIGGTGRAPTVLSCPVILPDDPAIAAQSHGDTFDALEIEELLALRIATLTAEEQEEASATDPRAAAIMARFGELRPEQLGPLHAGMVAADAAVPGVGGAEVPGDWSLLLAAGGPGGAQVMVDGTVVRAGTPVELRPAPGGDAHDLFLQGRRGTVVDVFEDVDGRHHVAVAIDDDPGRDLARGRHRYFAPHELVPVRVASG